MGNGTNPSDQLGHLGAAWAERVDISKGVERRVKIAGGTRGTALLQRTPTLPLHPLRVQSLRVCLRPHPASRGSAGHAHCQPDGGIEVPFTRQPLGGGEYIVTRSLEGTGRLHPEFLEGRADGGLIIGHLGHCLGEVAATRGRPFLWRVVRAEATAPRPVGSRSSMVTAT